MLTGMQLDASSVGGSFTYSPPLGTFLSAGNNQSLMVTFKPTDATDYTNAIDTLTINVNPAALTVMANNKSMSYGETVPTLDDTITGFVNGETQSVVSGAASLSTTATSSSHAGGYPIDVNVSGLSAANYTFVAQNGTFTINQATPTINWTTPAAITYGTKLTGTQLDASSPVGGTFTYSPQLNTVLGPARTRA